MPQSQIEELPALKKQKLTPDNPDGPDEIPLHHRPNAVQSFEGPEKVLEVWFKYPKDIAEERESEAACRLEAVQKVERKDGKLSETDIEASKFGLRVVSRETWQDMLDLVRCQIMSVMSNEHCDAFVLSESSLFVYRNRVILKTCGTTTLLKAVTKLLEIAGSVGLTEVDDIFYCRKNFLYPDNQLFPHSSFSDECTFLDEYFDGSGYVMGKTNGDHWYLYISDCETESVVESQNDQTIEILMSDLSRPAAKKFYKDADFVSSQHLTQTSGIADILPGSIIDDFMFDPCGYSMNGLRGEEYFTIHVTPQPQCSYASFETNATGENLEELVNKVLKIFEPGQFTVTLFGNMQVTSKLHNSFPREMFDCKRTSKTLYEFDNNYKLSFNHYIASAPSQNSPRFSVLKNPPSPSAIAIVEDQPKPVDGANNA